MTHRKTSLRATYGRVARHISRITGAVWNVRSLPIPEAEHVFYVYAAQHSVVTHIDSMHAVRLNLTTQSSAIARTKEEAKTLAICEALERWCCVYQGTEPFVRTTYNELKSQALWPNAIHLFSDEQYEHRVSHNRISHSPADFVPERFLPNQKIAWCPVWSLTQKRWRSVLMSSCFFGWHDEDHVFSAADSRGVAAGPTLEFCIGYALLELIQTDAVAIWHANFLPKPQVDIDSFEDPYFDAIRGVHDRLGRDLWVVDVTADIPGLPIFAALSRDRQTGNVIKGFGAHPMAQKSLRRALMECSQMLVNVLPTPDENMPLAQVVPLKNPQPGHKEKQEQVHLVPASHKPLRTWHYYKKRPTLTTIQDLISLLQTMGIEVFMHDVTRPEIGLHVVRVFAPGLRSWFGRYAPGRLYSVPVALQERARAITENEVNKQALEDWTTTVAGPEIRSFLAHGSSTKT